MRTTIATLLAFTLVLAWCADDACAWPKRKTKTVKVKGCKRVKICRKGKPCGKACIARDRKCHQKPNKCVIKGKK